MDPGNACFYWTEPSAIFGHALAGSCNISSADGLAHIAPFATYVWLALPQAHTSQNDDVTSQRLLGQVNLYVVPPPNSSVCWPWVTIALSQACVSVSDKGKSSVFVAAMHRCRLSLTVTVFAVAQLCIATFCNFTGGFANRAPGPCGGEVSITCQGHLEGYSNTRCCPEGSFCDISSGNAYCCPTGEDCASKVADAPKVYFLLFTPLSASTPADGRRCTLIG